MKNKAINRILSLLLALILLLSAMPLALAEVTVTLRGFITGNTTNLRVSELLEARVEGYEGDVSKLTYVWTNDLGTVTTSSGGWWPNFGGNRVTYYGTYLYVYSSHNMYSVQGTNAEIEIYNSARGVNASDNMSGRAYDQSFSGVGYAYAAVYGANLESKDYTEGSISVAVYAPDGTLLGTATYSGFEAPSLDSDLDEAVFGVFVGDTIDVRDLLGESAIVHVACTASSVTEASIVSGSQYISVAGNAPAYTVTGLEKGVAQINISVTKSNCKFHQYQSASTSPTVYVFQKPTVTPALTTLTLTELDDDCTYYIGSQQGVKNGDGTIVFEGLTPSTTYEIEVRGHYTDNGTDKVVYAYVYGTTLTPNTASVTVRLDNNVCTLEDVGLQVLYLRTSDGAGDPIALEYSEQTQNYLAQVADGIYWIYDESGNRISDYQEIVVSGTDATTVLSYFTVTYDTDGGELYQTDTTQIYYVGDDVHATSEIPYKDGYRFVAWEYAGMQYAAGSQVTGDINAPIPLKAIWEEAIDVYINITIDHIDPVSGKENFESDKHNIAFTADGKVSGAEGDYDELANMTILWDGESEFAVDGYTAQYTTDETEVVTVYTATAPTFENCPKDYDYTATAAKSGYDVVSVTSTTMENGDVVIEMRLQYDPDDFDLKFSVELDEQARALPAEDKPIAANVKITAWYDAPYDAWSTITQHTDTYYHVVIDADSGIGEGSYLVWQTASDTGAPYHYRLQVVSYVFPDGSVVAAEDVDGTHTTYICPNGRYTAAVQVTDGAVPATATALAGVYYDGAEQQGELKAVISIRTHTLTLDANGGSINDGDTYAIEKLLSVPDLSEYIPTREGGYAFAGWYKDLKFSEQVEIGSAMSEDIILYAKWLDPINVIGSVTVEYFYDNNGVLTYINESDRLTYTTVLLRRSLVGTENYVTVNEQVVSFEDISQATASTDYAFTGIPVASGSGGEYEYIIAVRQSNYNKTYTEPYEYLAYNTLGEQETRYAAYDPQFVEMEGYTGLVGETAVLLSFAPVETVLPFYVDVTAIHDPACQPTSVEVVYEYAVADSGTPVWNVIAQHTGDNSTLSVKIADGKAEGKVSVWNTTPDGHYEYLYRLKVVSYTLPNGTKVGTDNNTMFNIYYSPYVSVSSENFEVHAVLSPLPLTLTLDTAAADAELLETGYTHAGDSEETDGTLYTKIFYYGTGVPTLPVPTRVGYSFNGWYDAEGNPVTEVSTLETNNVYLTAKWKEGFTVNFFSNNVYADEEVFRTYHEYGTHLDSDHHNYLTADGALPETFYDIPTLDYEENNKFIFAGWYYADGTPLKWTDTFKEETDLYAGWITVDTVAQDAADTKSFSGGEYNEYDLVGVQIRTATVDPTDHYGEADSGLRYITVLSQNVYDQINNLDGDENTQAEYGFVFAKTSTIAKYAALTDSPDTYELKYKGSNVNGEDTSVDYSYVKNVKCSGVSDHFGCEKYRLYTAVVTYTDLSGDLLTRAHATNMTNRAYIRYTDANALERVYYNNYTGTPTYNGCSTNYAAVAAALGVE